MAPIDRVVIAGGGVGGLALARALQVSNAANSVIVLEKRGSTKWDPDRGLGLFPHAETVIKHMGLAQEFRKFAYGIHPAGYKRFHTPFTQYEAMGSTLTPARWLATVTDPGVPWQRDRGALTSSQTWDARKWNQYLRVGGDGIWHDFVKACKENTLLEMFENSLDERTQVLTGKAVADIVIGSDREAVVICEDGSEYAADLVVGADGVQSKVRKSCDPTELVPAGMCAGGLRYYEDIPISNKFPRELLIRPGMRLAEVPITSAVRGLRSGEATWFYTNSKLAHDVPITNINRHMMEMLRERAPYGDFETYENLWYRPLWRETSPLQKWHKGPCVLLGDACHPLTPNLAQSASLALEDAWVLARELSTRADKPVSAALENYERLRRPRVSRVRQITALTQMLSDYPLMWRLMGWCPKPVIHTVFQKTLQYSLGSGEDVEEGLPGLTAYEGDPDEQGEESAEPGAAKG